MRNILVLLFFLITKNLYSQQVIALCEDSQNEFIYTTFSNQLGNYSWFLDDEPLSDSDSSIIIDWSDKNLGVHSISVFLYTIDGCISPTISYTVDIVSCPLTTVYIPNAFTPDGDGLNNIWFPVSYDIKKIEFTIYNKWGQKIYESTDNLFGWDGSFQGKPCPNDVYVYFIKWTSFDDKVSSKFGQITLFR